MADTLFQGSSVKRFTFQFGSFICSVKFDGSICVGPSIRLSLLRSHRSVRPFVLLSLLPQSLLPPLRPSFCPLSRPSLYLSILHFVHYERQSSSFYPPIGLSITPSVLHRCSDTVRPSIFPRSSLRPSIRRYVRAPVRRPCPVYHRVTRTSICFLPVYPPLGSSVCSCICLCLCFGIGLSVSLIWPLSFYGASVAVRLCSLSPLFFSSNFYKVTLKFTKNDLSSQTLGLSGPSERRERREKLND